MKILVTGAAGFIGFHTVRRLLGRGDEIVGIDNLNDYYDPSLKAARLKQLDKAAQETSGQWTFYKCDIAEKAQLSSIMDAQRFDRVIHLAAQAGVRHSLIQPEDYVQSNLVGFSNILEVCRSAQIQHLTYASTSSVYGANTKLPFSEHDSVDHPLQFYAATKRANELMAHSYSHLFDMPTTGLRFFTVYGPWGRPDMALFRFTKAILAGEPIELYNQGNHSRDFTYIDDIVEGVVAASDKIASSDANWKPEAPDPATSDAPFKIYNIGNSERIRLLTYVEALERALGLEANRTLLPEQPGDAPNTHADIQELSAAVGYRPQTSIEEGVAKFVEWYRDFY